jgi:hypothetical protein
MRAAAVLVAAIVLSPLAVAQMDETSFTTPRHLRVAYGDVPLSPAVEPDGRWNAVVYHRIQHGGGALDEPFTIPQGFLADGATCTCGAVNWTAAGGRVTAPDVAAGTIVVAVASHLASSPSDPIAVTFPDAAGKEWSAAFYLRQGQSVAWSGGAPQVLPGAQRPEYTIHQFTGSGAAPVFTVNAAGVEAVVPPAAGPNPWLYAAVAFVVGAVVWALLVRQGVVQKRSRKQVVAMAAHEQIAAKETAPVLEGKKRALLAALKDVELAHQSKEMDTATYDAVKGEFKRQAVTVMRALETVETGKKE